MNNSTDNTIDLKALMLLFLEKFWIILIAMVVGGAAAFGYSKYLLPLEYSSHISMYVQSYTNTSTSTDNQQNNISNSKQLINTYIEVLKDDAVMRAVGTELQKMFSEEVLQNCFRLENGTIVPSSLKAAIHINSVNDTSALTVQTTTKDPEVAAAICNTLAVVAPDFIQDAVGVGSISTIDTARANNSPVAPNTMKNTAIGILAGMLLAMLVIFLVDFFDNTVKNTEELSQRYEKAIIGAVQKVELDKSKKKGSRKGAESVYVHLTDDNIPFAIVESYKLIRTNITFALSTYEKKILAISSANPNEGKSTAAANIAIAAAQSGNSVLLIDADMRKPVQHKIFKLKNKKGLSAAISKIDTVDSCIQKSVMENLDVMTAGRIPPNPSELLSSAAAAEMFDTLSKRYALIIIDLPPVCVVSDALTLSGNVAGMVMVAKYGETTFDALEEAMRRTEQANMNLLGFILGQIETKHHNAKYYSYKNKYGYGGYGYGYDYKEKSVKEESDTSC